MNSEQSTLYRKSLSKSPSRKRSVADLLRRRKEIVRNLQDKFPNFEFELDRSGKTIFERAKSIKGCGYLRVRNPNGTLAIPAFDYDEEEDTFRIHFVTPEEFDPKNLYFIPLRAKNINYERLNEIKKRNGGIIMPKVGPEEMLEEIKNAYILFTDVEDKLHELIHHEWDICRKENLGTRFSWNLDITTNGFEIYFAVNCDAIKSDSSMKLNMHMRDVTKTLYNGAIIGRTEKNAPIFIDDVSSHH